MLNLNSSGLNGRYANTSRAVIRSIDDSHLQFMLEVGQMARQIKGIRSLRVRQLTCEAANFIYYTCCGFD